MFLKQHRHRKNNLYWQLNTPYVERRRDQKGANVAAVNTINYPRDMFVEYRVTLKRTIYEETYLQLLAYGAKSINCRDVFWSSKLMRAITIRII